MPQNVRYRLKTSTSRSVNSSWPTKKRAHVFTTTTEHPINLNCLTIRFVYNLSDTNNVALVITDRHRQNDVCFVASLEVDVAVKARITVSIFYVHDVFGFGDVPRNTNAKRYDELLRLREPNGVIEGCGMGKWNCQSRHTWDADLAWADTKSRPAKLVSHPYRCLGWRRTALRRDSATVRCFPSPGRAIRDRHASINRHSQESCDTGHQCRARLRHPLSVPWRARLRQAPPNSCEPRSSMQRNSAVECRWIIKNVYALGGWIGRRGEKESMKGTDN